MKLKYKLSKIYLLALIAVMAASCEEYDPFKNVMDVGQTVPTTYWELGSTVAKAGSDVSFSARFYPATGDVIDRAEVWTAVTRSESAAATVALTSSLSYTQTEQISDTLRRAQLVAEYPLSMATLDGTEYLLASTFPTSQTLSPISWVSPTEWNEETFELYYSDTFQETFTEKVINYLTADSTYYTDLRLVYVSYDFTAEQFNRLSAEYGVNFPDQTGEAEEGEGGGKSDLWYYDTETVVGQYYIYVDANGVSHEVELAEGETAPEGTTAYDVYDSSEWVFCRYSDDKGASIVSVRDEYIPFFIALLQEIPFIDWIYSDSDQAYMVSFSRKYILLPYIYVYNTAGKAGTDSNSKEVELN
ncbi:MAG: hypothetical protein R3Y22_03785 [Bacteroidales bacterium]